MTIGVKSLRTAIWDDQALCETFDMVKTAEIKLSDYVWNTDLNQLSICLVNTVDKVRSYDQWISLIHLISSWCNVFNLIQLSCSNIETLILRKRYKAHTKMNKTLSLVRRKCKLSEIKSRGNLMALSVINLTVTWHCTHRFFNDMEDKEPWSFVINLSQSKSFDRTSFCWFYHEENYM